MNKTNAINAKTSRKFNRNSDIEVKILSPNDKNIQCTILKAPFYAELRGFNIENKTRRKILIRAIFGWVIGDYLTVWIFAQIIHPLTPILTVNEQIQNVGLIALQTLLLLQNFIYLPFMYLFLQKLQHLSESLNLNFIIWPINLGISVLLYRFRAIRRPIPNAVFSLVFVTITNSVQIGLLSVAEKNIMILSQPLILICQLGAILLYTVQSKFELTNFRAVIIAGLVYSIFIILNIFVFQSNAFIRTSSAYGIFAALYIVIDTQLMLTSPTHNYQMAENEHVFGAVNIYADQSKLAWLLLRWFFLDSAIDFFWIAVRIMTAKLY